MVLTFVNPTLDPPPELVTVSVSVSFVFKHFARRLFEVPGNEALSTEALTDRSHLHLAAIIAMDRGDNWEITPSGWAIALIDRGTPAYFTNHWYLTSKEIICFTTKIIRRMVTIFLIFEFALTSRYVISCSDYKSNTIQVPYKHYKAKRETRAWWISYRNRVRQNLLRWKVYLVIKKLNSFRW